MKIAIIRQRYNPYGGAERFVERAMAALRSRQAVELSIITRKWPGGEQRAIECTPFYLGSLWRDWGFARCVCKRLKDENFDLVQSHERLACCDVYRAGDGVHAEWLRQRGRVQTSWQRFTTRLNPYHRYVLAAERKMFLSHRLRAVICISELVKSDVLRHFPVDPAKLHVIYNGVDLQHFRPNALTEESRTCRATLHLAPTDRVLLFVGSGFERKGLRTAIEVLAQLPADVHLVVVGKDKHVERYRQQAQTLGVASRCHFVGGQRDVRPWYGLANALIFPTLYEPFGNVVLEAMASGLPVATTPTAGGAELVQEGVNGIVADALDVDRFVAGLTRLLQPTVLAHATREARATAERYTWEAMTARMVALYEQLLAADGV